MSIFILILTSCTNDVDIDNDQLDHLVSNQLNTKSSGDGIYDLLGYGYDVTGDYFEPYYSGSKILNLEELIRVNSTNITITDLGQTECKLIVGANKVQYTEKLTKKAGFNINEKWFKGSVDKIYNNDNEMSHSYASCNLMIKNKRIRINLSPSQLIPYLTSDFITDIENLSPQQIISKYGTHVLIDIIVGGKLTINYRCVNQNIIEQKEESVSASALITINKLFNLTPSYDGNTNTSLTSYNKDQIIHFKTTGGDPSRNLMGNLTPNDSPINIASWQNSCNFRNYPERARLIDIHTGGVIPIWELVQNSTKKAQLKTTINNYIYENQYLAKLQLFCQKISGDWKSIQFKFGGFYDGGFKLGYIYNEYKSGTVPLYRFHDKNHKNVPKFVINFNDVKDSKYVYQNIVGYVYNSSGSNRIPVTTHWTKKYNYYFCRIPQQYYNYNFSISNEKNENCTTYYTVFQ